MEAEGYLVQSGQFTGMKGGKHSEAVDAIIDWLGEQGLGRKTVQFRLRDWLISRQRYWGNPIPMIHCDCCGDVPFLMKIFLLRCLTHLIWVPARHLLNMHPSMRRPVQSADVPLSV